MKKCGILNENISRLIASLGHNDKIVVCDAGFPVPINVEKVDVAIGKNLPNFLDTIKIISTELYVEKIIVANELSNDSKIYKGLNKIFKDIEITSVPHEQIKEISAKSKAVIRTGEFTPYANAVLICGVVF